MTRRTSSPTFMRNVLLATAGILLVVAFLINPVAYIAFKSMFWGLMAMVGSAGVACAAAQAVRSLERSTFRESGYPWYRSLGAIAFLVVTLPFVVGAFGLFDHLFLMVCRLSGTVSGLSRTLEYLAMFLLWVTVLDWPRPLSGNDGGQGGPPGNWQHIPRQ